MSSFTIEFTIEKKDDLAEVSCNGDKIVGWSPDNGFVPLGGVLNGISFEDYTMFRKALPGNIAERCARVYFEGTL